MLSRHEGQVIGVLGLGRSGLAAIAALQAAGTNILPVTMKTRTSLASPY